MIDKRRLICARRSELSAIRSTNLIAVQHHHSSAFIGARSAGPRARFTMLVMVPPTFGSADVADLGGHQASLQRKKRVSLHEFGRAAAASSTIGGQLDAVGQFGSVRLA
jgi:hypothetical protein